jgi:geranyl-CoA carboxylase alpha subunit
MNTILIANRGEIALRVIRTVQRMGYRAVAVYSDADVDAPHVRAVDNACRIGPALARDSYLNQAAILEAAHTLGADAVHPGYGFLAENAEFAQVVMEAGLTWIGPPPSAMQAMGNKAAAKRLLSDPLAGQEVPLLPGYQGRDQGDATLLAEANRIGLPLMIKAAAGGGGRGMRLVYRMEDVAHNVAQARSEAQQAFGSGELILERALIKPRHVEVQVFADSHGNVVHLGERDCSVQRRHQKIIEEAPSPAVNAQLRERLGAAAVAATRQCAYVGAGTIEFLLDTDGAFWFMEMNTRLQVEHPVTEAITGLDLVEWQIRVAAGECLPLTQAEIDSRLQRGGHAIEVRLCAEDTANNFLPQTGRVALWQAPSSLRVEHALETGQEISSYYDSMVAKLISHAPNRDEARLKLAQQLDGCVLLGVSTNQDLLLDILRHSAFVSGAANTGFIEEYFSSLSTVTTSDAASSSLLALGLLLTCRVAQQPADYPAELRGWSSCASLPHTMPFELDGVAQTLTVSANGFQHWRAEFAGQSFNLVVQAQDQHRLRVLVDGNVTELSYAQQGDYIYFRCGARSHRLRDLAFLPIKTKNAAAGDGIIRAPMNGRVASLPVQAGQQVEAGQTLIVLEAMKMEHALLAPHAGVLHAMHVSLGEQVEPGRILAELVKP